VSQAPQRLLLFDIDGTLVAVHAISKLVLSSALERVFGTAGEAATVSLAGKVDSQVIMDLMIASGWRADQVASRLPQMAEAMADIGRHHFRPDHLLRPCPGVPALLAALRGAPELASGLVTGNMAPTATLKLAGAGLEPEQFAVGAFGSDAADRNLLPGIALERAALLFGRNYGPDSVLVIGDTPADIACAHHAGLPVLAVATGGYSIAELAAYHPDFLLPDLQNTTNVLGLLRGD
jgi:phosphoglycolate phosphatase-like HAD superfamily hydrolase